MPPRNDLQQRSSSGNNDATEEDDSTWKRECADNHSDKTCEPGGRRGQAHGDGAGRAGQEGDLRLGSSLGNAQAATRHPTTTRVNFEDHGEDEFHDIPDEEFYDAVDFPDEDGDHEPQPKAFQAYPTEVFEDEEYENYLYCGGDHLRRDRKPIFWEIYAGEGGLSDAMEKLGDKVRRFDLPDWNFENVADRRRLWKLYVEEAPDVVWIAPPCTLWTPLQTWNKDLDALEVLWTRRRFDHKSHLSMARRLYRGQLKRKKVGVVEHPWTCSAWKTPAFKNLGGHTVDLDQCACGSVLPGDDGLPTPIKKRTCLKVTVEGIVEELNRKCPGDHVHQHVIGSLPGGGSRAKAAGAYQPGFCHALAAALDRAHLGYHGRTCETRDVVDTALLKYANGDDTAEEIARLALSNEDYSYRTLEKVASAIDGQAQREGRRKKDGQLEENEFIFIGGLWQFGGKHGITKGTILYPTVCQYFNAFFRSRGHVGWSSFYLGKNIQTKVHIDCHNLRNTTSKTTSFGDFTGGCLWTSHYDNDDENVSGEDVVQREDRTGRMHHGHYVNTKEIIYEFDARLPRCTEEWTGTRWCLTMYTGRSLPSATQQLRNSLRSHGFPLARKNGKTERQVDDNRPKRGLRRSLWKNAKRMSALATWSILAATSMASTGCDEGLSSTALFELGGMQKTIEAAICFSWNPFRRRTWRHHAASEWPNRPSGL